MAGVKILTPNVGFCDTFSGGGKIASYIYQHVTSVTPLAQDMLNMGLVMGVYVSDQK